MSENKVGSVGKTEFRVWPQNRASAFSRPNPQGLSHSHYLHRGQGGSLFLFGFGQEQSLWARQSSPLKVAIIVKGFWQDWGLMVMFVLLLLR